MKPLSNRQMQAWAALCVQRYCATRGIRHPDIDALIQHLASILVAADLPEWAAELGRLRISGLGDPIPSDVLAAVPRRHQESFHKIVEFAVEVGMSDMFGASTGEPLRSMNGCRDILSTEFIKAPDLETVAVFDPEPLPWGNPATADAYAQFQRKNFTELVEGPSS